jgi:putative SOS response-associated peptidase YedK
MLARWGLIPFWWKEARPPASTINARAEDAATKPMWRDAYRRQRCLVPATHYFEWMKSDGGKISRRP